MRFGNALAGSVLAAALVLSSCSSDTTETITLASVVQDLGEDPDGLVTVATFTGSASPGLAAGHFESDGGQTPVGIVIAGNVVTVTWDDRVTPSHQVRVAGHSNVVSAYTSVTSSDATAPTFTVDDGVQTVGLGGDTITVSFTGPRVVETQAEDPANWELTINGSSVDLTGSTFALDPTTQTLTATLGTSANLWGTFDLAATGLASVSDVAVAVTPIAGTADDDVTAPTLVGGTGVQNLTADPYGRVVDFTFSEAMDPNFGVQSTSYDAGFPVLAADVEQVAGDPTTIRVTFTKTILPGTNDIFLSGLYDAHGNALVGGVTAVAQPSPVSNAYTSDPVVEAVEGAGGDRVVVVTDQALYPDDAEDPTKWTLLIDGSPVAMGSQLFDYDFLARTLTISLADDYGYADAFTLTPVAPREVDGETFTTVFAGNVTGDDEGPTVLSVLQNRNVDPSGQTVDVAFSETLDAVQAETEGNWTIAGLTVDTATLLGAGGTVRLALDDVVIPGDFDLDVTGVEDLAGNAMTAVVDQEIGSTDSTVPAAGSPVAIGLEGIENDTFSVTFDDDMVESEVETIGNWDFESPSGTTQDLTGLTVDYVPGNRTATLTFDSVGGFDFQVQDDFSAVFSNMRDIAGNTVSATPVTGTADVETDYPVIESVWVEDFLGGSENHVHVRFSEPMKFLDDAYHSTNNPSGLTGYLLLDDMGDQVTPQSFPISVALDADGRGADLTFGFTVTPGFHQLSVRGASDVAGNQMFPSGALPIASETANEPLLATGTSGLVIVSGENNDVLTIVFDEAISAWTATDPANYTMTDGVTSSDFANATFEFDGDRTVTVRFDSSVGQAFQESTGYTLTVDGQISAQGETMAASDAEVLTAAGDAIAPTFSSGRVRLDAADPTNSILIETNEALDPTDAADETLVDILGANPAVLTQIGPRTVRGTWAAPVAVSDVVNVSWKDLAGNQGVLSQATLGAETVGPFLSSVAGTIEPGLGGDRVSISFNEPVNLSTAYNPANYTVTQNLAPVDLSTATPRYESATNTVHFLLPAGSELQDGVDVVVSASGVRDHAGVTMVPGSTSGTTSGDAAAPSILSAMVNFREDATGRTVDVEFSEDLDTYLAGLHTSYDSSGGQVITSATLIADHVVRLSLVAPLGVGDTITVGTSDVSDLAGNLNPAPLVVTPVH